MPTEDLSTKILDVRAAAILNAQGRFVPGMAIDFTVGAHGPYTLNLPQDGYTAAVAKAAVEQRAAEIRMTLT